MVAQDGVHVRVARKEPGVHQPAAVHRVTFAERRIDGIGVLGGPLRQRVVGDPALPAFPRKHRTHDDGPDRLTHPEHHRLLAAVPVSALPDAGKNSAATSDCAIDAVAVVRNAGWQRAPRPQRASRLSRCMRTRRARKYTGGSVEKVHAPNNRGQPAARNSSGSKSSMATRLHCSPVSVRRRLRSLSRRTPPHKSRYRKRTRNGLWIQSPTIVNAEVLRSRIFKCLDEAQGAVLKSAGGLRGRVNRYLMVETALVRVFPPVE